MNRKVNAQHVISVGGKIGIKRRNHVIRLLISLSYYPSYSFDVKMMYDGFDFTNPEMDYTWTTIEHQSHSSLKLGWDVSTHKNGGVSMQEMISINLLLAKAINKAMLFIRDDFKQYQKDLEIQRFGK